MIKRTYFYSATRRDKEGGYAWWHGYMEFTSWLPVPAGELLDIAQREAKEGIEIVSGQKIWHDRNVRIVALNRI